MAKFVGVFHSESGYGGLALRAALISSAALAFAASVATPADAQRMRYFSPYYGYPSYYGTPSPRRINRDANTTSSTRAEPKKDPGFGEMPKGPLQIVVSIGSQKVTLFSNGQRVAQGPVSTGVPGHPTPLGVFSIIEKDRHHRSNIYAGAPMPFMQRITWSGIALHEGALPGHPASHGCIRLSHDFAQKLWPVTKLGVRVIVARSELAPSDFAHAKLFVPKAKPSAPEVAMAEPIRLAQVISATKDGVTMIDASTGAPEPAPAAVEESKTSGATPSAIEATKSAEPTKAAEPLQTTEAPAETKAGDDTKAADATRTDEPVKETGAINNVQSAEPSSAPLPPVELRKAVETPQVTETPKVTETPRVTEAPKAAEPPKPADVAPTRVEPKAADPVPVSTEPAKPVPSTIDPPKPAAPRIRAADQPQKRNGQVAVFVSRKEKKIFVRQGFAPIMEMPITIDEPDRPLGTHVFTAMEVTDEGAGMRWNLITVPNDLSRAPEPPRGRRGVREPVMVMPVIHKPASTAAEALERIRIPEEVMDRVGELLIPGSSLVISDEGLGRETGRGTEFIVLTR